MPHDDKSLPTMRIVGRTQPRCNPQRPRRFVTSAPQDKDRSLSPYPQSPTRQRLMGKAQTIVTWAILAVCAVALLGCSQFDKSLMNFMDALEAHKVQGCHDATITLAGGGGLGGGANGSFSSRSLIVSGGMTAAQCAEYKKALALSPGE